MGESFTWLGSSVQRKDEGHIAADAVPAHVQRHRRAHRHDKVQDWSIHGGASSFLFAVIKNHTPRVERGRKQMFDMVYTEN
eukprot:4461169-Pyramimonas_sp.AAC.1